MKLNVNALLKLKKDGQGKMAHSDGKELVYNAETKQLEEKTKAEIRTKPATLVTIRPEDADMFVSSVVIEERVLADAIIHRRHILPMRKIDDGDVYILSDKYLGTTENGFLFYHELPEKIEEDSINILISEAKIEKENTITIDGRFLSIMGYAYIDGNLCPLELNIIPILDNLFSRTDGLYETGKISDSSVAIFGLGSGGSPIALELVKAGVMNFSLIDYDRLEIVNIVRHVCGISDLGRYKTKAVKEMMLDKNPYAKIDTYEIKADYENEVVLRQIISKSDLVICATDNRESKILINKICLSENTVCIYGGAFRRACGGLVLRVIPHVTICYGCFLNLLPTEYTNNTEISNQRQATRISYADRIVPVEPGLSSDILPIAIFVVKLAILELLKNKEHSMASLYDDFTCPLYLWVNRREYQFENFLPMESNTDSMSIMRWYGVELEKDPNCLTCGSFSFSNEDDIF